MSDTQVGILITEAAQRDAIHVAVAPVISAGCYSPGENVGLLPDGRVSITADVKIGIIDPFLPKGVQEGDCCWLFLYPKTVTGIRHHWSHPAFSNEATPIADKSESEKWLRAYAVRLLPYAGDAQQSYLMLLDGLRTRELFAHGSDLHSLGDLEDADGLRKHAERVLGIRIDWDDYTFRCSC